jgi:hypothetical protein
MMIVEALIDSKNIEIINLSMNYIKDNGASFLVEAVRRDSFPSIKKISLGDN